MYFFNNSDYSLYIEYGKRYKLNVGESLIIENIKDIDECIVRIADKDRIKFHLLPFSKISLMLDNQIKMIVHFNVKINCNNTYEFVFENCKVNLSDSISCCSVHIKQSSNAEYFTDPIDKKLIIKYKILKILFSDFLPVGIIGFVIALLEKKPLGVLLALFIVISSFVNISKREKVVDLLTGSTCNKLFNEKSFLQNKVDDSINSKIGKRFVKKWFDILD